jgi:hypothetical protein
MESTTTPPLDMYRKKVFTGICLALVPTGFSFVLVSNILAQLKT